jgi:outer membrane protein OmpA-like peptidoglycan-associated protein
MNRVLILCLLLFAFELSAQRSNTSVWIPAINSSGDAGGFIAKGNQAYVYVEKLVDSVPFSKIHSSVFQNGSWQELTALNKDLNANDFNSVVGISQNGDTLYLLGAYSKSNPLLKGLALTANVDGEWIKPKRIPIKGLTSKSPFYNLYVHPSADWCLISMEKNTNKSDDIFISFRNKEKDYFEKPIPLGNTINTAESEITPFITNDGRRIVFARSVSYGDSVNYDLFTAIAIDSTLINWSEATPMSALNSEGFEGYYWCCNDKKAFYTASDSNNRFSIYTTPAPLESSKPNKPVLAATDRIIPPIISNLYKIQLPPANMLISRSSAKDEKPVYNLGAKLKFADTTSSIENVLVHAKNETGIVLDSTRTDEFGKFEFKNLPTGDKIQFSTPNNEEEEVAVALIDKNGKEEESMPIESFSNFVYQKLEAETVTLKLLDQLDDTSLDKYFAGELTEAVIQIEEDDLIENLDLKQLTPGVILDADGKLIKALNEVYILDENDQTTNSVLAISDSTLDYNEISQFGSSNIRINDQIVRSPSYMTLNDYLIKARNSAALTNLTIFDNDNELFDKEDSLQSYYLDSYNPSEISKTEDSSSVETSVQTDENRDASPTKTQTKEIAAVASESSETIEERVLDSRGLEEERSALIESDTSSQADIISENILPENNAEESNKIERSAKQSGKREIPINKKYSSSYDDFVKTSGAYADIIQTEEGVNYHFNFNAYTLTKEQIDYIIETIIPFYEENKEVTIILEGHTDSIGSKEVNERVSILRASSVLYALEKYGIEDTGLKIISKGETEPLAPNDTRIGRAMNRRVEIIYE